MSKKAHRSGGKFGKRHNTFTSLSAEIADSIVKLDAVKRIVSSVITCSSWKNSSCKGVKIIDTRTAVMIKVSDGALCHQIWVHSINKGCLGTIRQEIEKWCLGKKINVAFMHRPNPF